MRLTVRFVRARFGSAADRGLCPGVHHRRRQGPSGAVLPGVTVEASSPVLIEKVRTAVTDGTGQYRIVDLRAGTYSVTFTPHRVQHRQARRDRADRLVHGDVNADLRSGTLDRNDHRHRRDADRRRAERQAADDDQQRRDRGDAVGAIATPASMHADSGDARRRRPRRRRRPGHARHGGLRRRGRAHATKGACRWTASHGRGVQRRRRVGLHAGLGNAQEIAFTTSGGLGEAEVGGPAISIVPEDRRQHVKGSVLRRRRHRAAWSAATTRQELQDRGLTTPGKLLKLWDFNVGVGGPIMKDRLWYLRARSATKAAIARSRACSPT